MQTTFNTSRLVLERLDYKDRSFIRELVNTPGWLEFIGDRNVHSEEDASAYIKRITESPNIAYWVARRREDDESVGVVTLIKRGYLPHHDIGFAFLPAYAGKGYAFEAAKSILDGVLATNTHSHVMATTIPTNTRSINLLKRLGLKFDKVIEVEKEKLQVYSASVEELDSL